MVYIICLRSSWLNLDKNKTVFIVSIRKKSLGNLRFRGRLRTKNTKYLFYCYDAKLEAASHRRSKQEKQAEVVKK